MIQTQHNGALSEQNQKKRAKEASSPLEKVVMKLHC